MNVEPEIPEFLRRVPAGPAPISGPSAPQPKRGKGGKFVKRQPEHFGPLMIPNLPWAPDPDYVPTPETPLASLPKMPLGYLGDLSGNLAKTREAWFKALATYLEPWFASQGQPLTRYRIACGWTSRGLSFGTLGECWAPTVSADFSAEILISPIIDDRHLAASVLFHELCHAAVGVQNGHGHGGEFKRLCLAAGLTAPFETAGSPSNPGQESFKSFIRAALETVGEYPHSALGKGMVTFPTPGQKRKPGRPVLPPEFRPIGKRKSKTYLLKADCPCCGYTVRVTDKWATKAKPICPQPSCENHAKPMNVHDE